MQVPNSRSEREVRESKFSTSDIHPRIVSLAHTADEQDFTSRDRFQSGGLISLVKQVFSKLLSILLMTLLVRSP